jgi:hypothetical protein
VGKDTGSFSPEPPLIIPRHRLAAGAGGQRR